MDERYVRPGGLYDAKVRAVVRRVLVVHKGLAGNGRWYWRVDPVEETWTATLTSSNSFLGICCPQCTKGRGANAEIVSGVVWFRCGTCQHAYPLLGK